MPIALPHVKGDIHRFTFLSLLKCAIVRHREESIGGEYLPSSSPFKLHYAITFTSRKNIYDRANLADIGFGHSIKFQC